MYNEAAHWRLLNMLLRLFGIMGYVAAAAFAFWAVHYWQNPVEAASIRTVSGHVVGETAMVSGLCCVIALLFTIVIKPYRPDLRVRDGRNELEPTKRSWWTGEPKR
jgi:hypothetical protein